MADEKDAEPKHKPTYTGAFRVNTALRPGFPITYSDYVAVQSTHYELLLTFFQLDLPLIEGGDQEAIDKFTKNPVVESHCVARIAIPLAQAGQLFAGIREHLLRLNLLDETPPKKAE